MTNDGKELRLGPGTVIDNRFEIVAFLGAGGMGSVYRARQLEFNRDVAIKFLHRRFCEDVSAVKRFQREAKIVAKLQHKNILTAYAFGGFEGHIYLATEFVGGRSLGAMIHERGPIPPEQALPLLVDICDAMQYAHQQDVLHRDLKPDNVLIVAEPGKSATAKVLDFGLSKLLGSNNAGKLTRTGEVVGDPRYMSPEQCQGQRLDERSDIYSFGCLMYEVLSGVWPFERDDAVAIMQCHLSHQPESFARRLGLPLALEAICFTAMSKSPNDRFESFDALSKHLKDVLANPNLTIAMPSRHGARPKLAIRPLALASVLISIVAGIALLAFAPPDIWLARIQNALPTDPKTNLENSLKLAAFHFGRGDLEESASLYTSAQHLAEEQRNDEASLLSTSGLVSVRVQQHDDKEVVSTCELLLAEGVQLLKGPGAPAETANSAIRNGVSELIRLNPSEALPLSRELADLYKARKLNGDARKILELIAPVGGDVERANNYFALGQLALQDADKTAAASYFDRAISTAPGGSYRMLIMQLVGSALMTAGDFKSALEYWKKLEVDVKGKAYPGRSQLYMCMGDCYANLHELPPARDFYSAAVSIEEQKQTPSYAILVPSVHGAGLSEFALADFASAEQSFKKEIQILESQPSKDERQLIQAMSMLGDSLTFQKREQDAHTQFERALELIQNSRAGAGLESIRQSLVQKLARTSATSAGH